ncbi:hypothetical protein CZ794_00105 [Psychrobacter sp. JB385]|nr:hypothetical protein CZ794_00105 [Psychrobacter sp. JB385]
MSFDLKRLLSFNRQKTFFFENGFVNTDVAASMFTCSLSFIFLILTIN